MQNPDWRELRCTEHVNSKNNRDAVKGEPMKATSAYNNKKCRCDTCKLAKKLKSNEYYEQNKDKVLDQRRKYCDENRDKIYERDRMYKQTPAGKAAIRRVKLKRRSSDQEFFESMTHEEHAEFYRISEYFHPLVETHVDHVIPVALGGTSHPSNLAVLTAHENVIKNDRHPGEWYYCTVPLAGRYRIDN